MKKIISIFALFVIVMLITITVSAQCSICTKTAQQLGERPAEGLNSGILYLMFTPFILVGFIGFRWWKYNKNIEADN